MTKENLRFELEALITRINETRSYRETLQDGEERKTVDYQLVAMNDYRACLEQRLSLR